MAKIVRYDMEFEEGSNDLSIELACYREPTEFRTGLKPEQHFKNAFKIMWPEFKWNEWMELMAWAWCNFRIVSVMGHTRAGKTFLTSHFALLDYLAAPQETATTMTTTKFDALKSRMWGDLMRAVESARTRQHIEQLFKITSTSNEMKMVMRGTKADEKFMIQGVATDVGDETASKIRGQHTDRRRILVDEAQDVAIGIYSAFTNAMSAPDFKGWLLTNPVEKISEYGNWSAPKGGYGSISDRDLFWYTERGVCLHLDGLQSPNIKAGRTLYPQMMTQSYVDEIRRANGEGSLEWWMYVRGFFPPDGTVSRIWPSQSIEKAKGSAEFDFAPTPFASLDPAFDHDDCVLILGVMGRLRDQKMCAVAKSSTKIKTDAGSTIPKEYQIAREVIRLCKGYGVQSENYIQDETGNGRGVLAIMRTEWDAKCQGISYGGEATERPLRLNDPKPAKELVRYFVTELWARASYLAQEGMLCGVSNLDKKTVDDLNARRYTIKQFGDRKLMIAESKDEMKKRLGRSPDFGDAVCQVAELMVRKGYLDTAGVKGGIKSQWRAGRQRAIKASRRFSEEKEFAHGHS